MEAHLSPDRVEKLRRLFDKVVELPAGERAAFLDEACSDDPTLLRELSSLLNHADGLSRIDHASAAIIEPLLKDLLDPHRQSRFEGLVGREVAHYRITERLGGGGMGVVYKALDTRLDRTVALKFLPPDLTRDPAAKARFVHEAKAASALDHNHICTIYDIGEAADATLFIAMAYYDGESISAKIERGRLSVEESLEYAVQAASGLSAAHAAGIVHRDVKPANLMVTDHGQVKIVDFGLAKMAGRTQLTRTDTTLGTVAYMSPEQARGEAVDERTDVWSLGVVLYEMLAGRRPFQGEFYQAVIYSILNEPPELLRHANPEVPPELEKIVHRALQKNPEARYRSVADLRDELKLYLNRLRGLGAMDVRKLLRRVREPRVAMPVVAVLLVAVATSIWFSDRQAKIRWAREEALSEVERLVEVNWRDFAEAFQLAAEAERYIPNDPQLAALMDAMTLRINVRTDPLGAAVYMKLYEAPERDWEYVGETPIDSLRVPITVLRWKLEKEGYEAVLAAGTTWDLSPSADGQFLPNHLERTLDATGSIPEGMVRVSGADTPDGRLNDFLIDRFEVTNEEYKAFVDAGGYRDRAHWEHEFVKDGRTLTWEEAMAEFVDRTGRPGPSTWQAGDYPDEQGDFPVLGVSWYEAAAYAAFVGKSLPTGAHWGIARGRYTPMFRWPQLGGNAVLASFSNFRGDGPVAVGSLEGVTAYGAHDLDGNAREWCWNATAKGRLIRGGGWDDRPLFGNQGQTSPFDRSAQNGFRCVLYFEPQDIPASVFETIQLRETRNFYDEEPVSDAVFEVYREQFSYDPTDLNPRVESKDDGAEDWIHERISVDAAYGDERLPLHLFLPRNTAAPYQTVIYFPGSGSLFQESSEDIERYSEFRVFLSFLVKNGRAVLYPVYKGTFERQEMDAARVHVEHIRNPEAQSYLYVEYLTKWVKDFRRSIDYLESRPDIDSARLAYYGMSWGGLLGAIIPAVEDRLQASILAPGAIKGRARPEADQLNYITRVKIPTLMLNGRYDTNVGVENGIRPMYDLLGTPEEHKELKLYETDHIPPRDEYIKEMLAWLDRYLGPVQFASRPLTSR